LISLYSSSQKFKFLKYSYQQVGFLFYYQNIFSKSSRIFSYHFLIVLSVQ
jgi:hypothetical protein